MTPKERAAARQALEALEAERRLWAEVNREAPAMELAITALREALDQLKPHKECECSDCLNYFTDKAHEEALAEQAEQEPVAKVFEYALSSARQLLDYADDSDGCQYGTLSTSLVRDAMEQILPALIAAPQPVKQEPVAEVVSSHQAGLYDELPIGTKLYAAAPQPVKQEPVGVVTDEMKVLLKEGDSPCAIAMRFGGRIGTVEYNKLYIPLEKLAEQAEQEPVDGVLPCSFCGDSQPTVFEGSTFRWRVAVCNNCGAYAPEVRHDTLAEDQKQAGIESDAAAKVAWNTRAAPVRTKDLTEAELHQIWRDIKSLVGLYSFQEIARAVIAKFKEKNK